MKIIWILGMPGSGKGTLSKNILNEYNAKHICTGDLLRNSSNKEIKALLAKGLFAPTDLVIRLVFEEIGLTAEQMCLLDGFPRTKEQYEECVRQRGDRKADLVIWLTCSDETIVSRIKKRAETETDRGDSSEEVIRGRIQIYKEATEPIIERIRADGMICCELDTTEATPDEVMAFFKEKAAMYLEPEQ